MNFLRRRFSSGDLQGELRDENSSILTFKKGPSPSAPSSPSKSMSGTGITGRGPITSNKPAYNKDRCKTLLVIDDHHTDWFVYFCIFTPPLCRHIGFVHVRLSSVCPSWIIVYTISQLRFDRFSSNYIMKVN